MASVSPSLYSLVVKSAVTPHIRVDQELHAELESAFKLDEILTDFVEVTVRSAHAFRCIQASFHAHAPAASLAHHQSGVLVPVPVPVTPLPGLAPTAQRGAGPARGVKPRAVVMFIKANTVWSFNPAHAAIGALLCLLPARRLATQAGGACVRRPASPAP
jgi:hypothetical protein